MNDADSFPVIHMNPSTFLRLSLSALAAAIFCGFAWIHPPHPGPGYTPHSIWFKAGALALSALAAGYFMTTRSFDMRLEFRKDRFVFNGFRKHVEIMAADIDHVYCKGYDVLAMLGDLAYGVFQANPAAAEANKPYADTPHLTFILKSGRRVQIEIDASVEKKAIACLRDMLRNAGHGGTVVPAPAAPDPAAPDTTDGN
ncbi:MAG: hypothetical protein GC185_08315 [Alphaproteobacteria bacterium]|nr:hypothetical protein [Alphaproteobacteria bacterium]